MDGDSCKGLNKTKCVLPSIFTAVGFLKLYKKYNKSSLNVNDKFLETITLIEMMCREMGFFFLSNVIKKRLNETRLFQELLYVKWR